MLAQQGVSLRILTMPSISAIDIDAIACSVNETRAIFTLEEHRVAGGLGAAVAEELLEAGLRPSIFYRFGIHGDDFVTDVGKQSYMKTVAGLDGQSVAAKIFDMLAATDGK